MKRNLSLLALLAFSGAVAQDDSVVWHQNDRGQEWPVNSRANGNNGPVKAQETPVVQDLPKTEVPLVSQTNVVSEKELTSSPSSIQPRQAKAVPVPVATSTFGDRCNQWIEWGKTQADSAVECAKSGVDAVSKYAQEHPNTALAAIATAGFTAGFGLGYLWKRSKRLVYGTAALAGAALAGALYSNPAFVQSNSLFLGTAAISTVLGLVAENTINAQPKARKLPITSQPSDSEQ